MYGLGLLRPAPSSRRPWRSSRSSLWRWFPVEIPTPSALAVGLKAFVRSRCAAAGEIRSYRGVCLVVFLRVASRQTAIGVRCSLSSRLPWAPPSGLSSVCVHCPAHCRRRRGKRGSCNFGDGPPPTPVFRLSSRLSSSRRTLLTSPPGAPGCLCDRFHATTLQLFRSFPIP